MEIEIKPSNKARRVAITIYHDGRVVVTKPKSVSTQKIEHIIHDKQDWIDQKRAEMILKPRRKSIFHLDHAPADVITYKKAALLCVEEKISTLNAYYQLGYKRISIRNQKSRWGSCSLRKNLSFNYRIIFLPPLLQDYLITHELCHLKEMNHGPRFWNLIAETIPDYKERRKELKRM